MARSRGSKIELTAYDDLFQTDESREEAALSKIRDIPISEIDEFPDHPFKVLMNEDTLRIALMKVQGYSVHEVALRLGITEKAVYRRMDRLREKIKKFSK